MLHGDNIRIGQVLLNLVSNATKFNETGALDEPNGCYQFSVEDTGIGLSELQRQKLFSRFAQADSSTTHKFG